MMNSPPPSDVSALRQSKNTQNKPDTAGHDPELMKLHEVAAMLRLSHASVYRLAARGFLPVYRVCRRMLFKRQDVLDCLERAKTGDLSD